MSNRHLPAGQNIQGGGGVPGVDMSGGPGGRGRRQPPPSYVPQYPHQHMNPMYPANYMGYGGQPYYGMPQQYGGQYPGQYQAGQYPNNQYQNVPYGGQYQGGQYGNGQYQSGQYQNPQYQNGGMPSPGYMQYPGYGRSPPSMPQYVPMAGVSVSPSYHRSQQSPALATPYQPPPAPAPIPPQTPSSTHSSQLPPPPTPPTPQSQEAAPPVVPVKEVAPELVPAASPASSVPAPVSEPAPVEVTAPAVPQTPVEPEELKAPFRPPLPWLSRPDAEFPARTTRLRRRRRPLDANSAAVSLPVEQHEASTAENLAPKTVTEVPSKPASSVGADAQSVTSTHQESSKEPTPATPTTPASVSRAQTDTATTATPASTTKTTARPAVPALPVVPALPKPSAKEGKAPKVEKQSTENASVVPDTPVFVSAEAVSSDAAPESEAAEAAPKPPARAPPSSWANLFAKPVAARPGRSAGPNGSATETTVNGTGSDGADGATNGASNNFSKASAGSVAEAVQAYRLGGNEDVPFLEPRGLINTGNMCYMNSVLQVLMFCIPFYDFLNQVGQRAAHSFKSDTPLVDAMIMFMREFKIIKSESSALALRKALKNEELERYGEPFTPEFVYEAIRQLPRFASMRRGHQQDAEEFLGFLLQSLDDECTSVMGSSLLSHATNAAAIADEKGEASEDWLEVGRKQRAAVTRSSGTNTSTPITKIFGGLLRSEFRVPGLKDSITTEPYQPLQLDIQSPDIRNVVDALKGLTRPERIHGDFNSPRGKDAVATKQVFIETLPPILILHLKRFQFDAEGNGTIKIWKKIGYPLELEIPREALSRQSRQTSGDSSLPKYRLVSVVYHHGKNASGGHYTVDVRRQDGREWIRIDDTVIRRVRSEDVAEGGEEEEVKEPRKDGASATTSGNRFGAINDEDAGDDDGWKQVTTSASGNKRWSSVVNGAGGAPKAKQHKDSIKDNKVAYLLFYQRV